ncbi:MAG: hypothetical protein H7125_06525 [Proteobacteria bacterium]|nr:hypothetical protein [Burkholderiales bacterium]
MHLLQTPREHARHHQGDKNTHYCTVTNLLNPVLEHLRFWRTLERVLAQGFGLNKRVDPTGGWTGESLAAASVPRTSHRSPLLAGVRRIQVHALRPPIVRRMARALGVPIGFARR